MNQKQFRNGNNNNSSLSITATVFEYIISEYFGIHQHRDHNYRESQKCFLNVTLSTNQVFYQISVRRYITYLCVKNTGTANTKIACLR